MISYVSLPMQNIIPFVYKFNTHLLATYHTFSKVSVLVHFRSRYLEDFFFFFRIACSPPRA